MLNLQPMNDPEITSEDTRILDLITDTYLQEVTVELLNQHSDEDKLFFANRVGDVVHALAKRKGFVMPGVPVQRFVQVLYSAALLHNLFYDEKDVTSLFRLRQVISETEHNNELIDAVIQSVEAHLGEETPVPMCKPATNSPSEMLATAVWIAKTYCTPQA